MKISLTRRVKLVHRKIFQTKVCVCHLMAYILKEIFKRNIFTRYLLFNSRCYSINFCGNLINVGKYIIFYRYKMMTIFQT